MNAPAKLVAFVCLVILGLGGGYAVGSAVGPIDQPTPVVAPIHEGHGW